MAALSSRYWHDLTTEEFRTLDAEATIAVLPVASIEQHGPHLPVSVDARLNEAVLAAALERLPADFPVLVLPPQPVGYSEEHMDFPGTLSLSAETTMRLWREIAESVAAVGIRRLVIFNSHGGQTKLLELVGRDLRRRRGMLVVFASWFHLCELEDLFEPLERRDGIHAGAIETAMMLAVEPDQVRQDRIGDFQSAAADYAERFRYLNLHKRTGFAWATQDLNPAGAVGDARAADAATGREVIDRAASGLAELLDEVRRFDLAGLKPAP